jgi:serine/threonine protein kinase
MARFMTETLLLKSLDHPNILRLNEMYQDAKRFFVVCELCHGGELFDTIENYVNTGKFCTESEAVYIISQMLSAISYLHQNEIIHMDLKPENVLFISKKD